jgi:hypothetical protein
MNLKVDIQVHDLEIQEAVAGCEQKVVLKLWVASGGKNPSPKTTTASRIITNTVMKLWVT